MLTFNPGGTSNFSITTSKVLAPFCCSPLLRTPRIITHLHPLSPKLLIFPGSLVSVAENNSFWHGMSSDSRKNARGVDQLGGHEGRASKCGARASG